MLPQFLITIQINSQEITVNSSENTSISTVTVNSSENTSISIVTVNSSENTTISIVTVNSSENTSISTAICQIKRKHFDIHLSVQMKKFSISWSEDRSWPSQPYGDPMPTSMYVGRWRRVFDWPLGRWTLASCIWLTARTTPDTSSFSATWSAET